MPLYNKAPYVAKAINSVLSQAFTDYELVIMDDGSSDNSYAVASESIDGQAHCHIHRQPNAGASMARNNAVALSRGDYLCFLDADDWWAPSFLEEMSRLIDGYPDAGIYGTNYTIVNETRHKTRTAPIGVDDGFERGYINYCQVFARTLAMPLWTGATCLSRLVFDEFGGFRPQIKIGEDFDLWIKVALKYKVAFLNKPLSFYYQDSDATWRLVSKLHDPKANMLWNLGYLDQEEGVNPDYKRLIDALRTNGLLPYYLTRKYRAVAKQELEKVDWEKQPKSVRKMYCQPVWYLIVKQRLRRTGSAVKQRLLRLFA